LVLRCVGKHTLANFLVVCCFPHSQDAHASALAALQLEQTNQAATHQAAIEKLQQEQRTALDAMQLQQRQALVKFAQSKVSAAASMWQHEATCGEIEVLRAQVRLLDAEKHEALQVKVITIFFSSSKLNAPLTFRISHATQAITHSPCVKSKHFLLSFKIKNFDRFIWRDPLHVNMPPPSISLSLLPLDNQSLEITMARLHAVQQQCTHAQTVLASSRQTEAGVHRQHMEQVCQSV
jgi:hypothetical protein